MATKPLAAKPLATDLLATEPPVPAVSPPPAAPSEADYRAFCAALSDSQRGRALLAEHARRSRQADTEMLLAAIGKLEARLRADEGAAQRLRDDLRVLITAVRLARPEIDTGNPAAQAVKLARLLDLMERRLAALADPPEAAQLGLELSAEALPPPEQPELPIPSPAALAPRSAVSANAPAPSDPLRALMALSEDERLALFT